MSHKLTKNKNWFIGLSVSSICCLVGAFSQPLLELKVYHQQELNQFKQPYNRVFVITETSNKIPHGFDESRAFVVSLINKDEQTVKLAFLLGSIVLSAIALYLGESVVNESEVAQSVKEIDLASKKELIIQQIKHKAAMASQSQKLLFKSELSELADLFGDTTLEASEINETDKFINAAYMMQEGHSIDTVVAQTWNLKINTPEHESMKQKFQEWLDSEN